MLTRITIALVALYLVHNGQNPEGGAGASAVAAGSDLSRAAISHCLDNPEPCRKALGMAAGLASPVAPRQPPAQISTASPPPTLEAPAFIATEAYPLPPRRPAGKKA
jgi:hypothetical protein